MSEIILLSVMAGVALCLAVTIIVNVVSDLKWYKEFDPASTFIAILLLLAGLLVLIVLGGKE